jgi:hypothetical protein
MFGQALRLVVLEKIRLPCPIRRSCAGSSPRPRDKTRSSSSTFRRRRSARQGFGRLVRTRRDMGFRTSACTAAATGARCSRHCHPQRARGTSARSTLRARSGNRRRIGSGADRRLFSRLFGGLGCWAGSGCLWRPLLRAFGALPGALAFAFAVACLGLGLGLKASFTRPWPWPSSAPYSASLAGAAALFARGCGFLFSGLNWARRPPSRFRLRSFVATRAAAPPARLQREHPAVRLPLAALER